jgi:prepilin-type N-terminal cleavage/methylation domain-containing protein
VVNRKSKIKGFTLVEVVIGLAVFAILITGVLSAYNTLARSVKSAREKVVLSNLSANYLEIVRNLPYSEVGTANGNPAGQLPDYGGNFPTCSNAYTQVIEGQTYKIYYEVTYVQDPADPIVGNPSYKQVKMLILNAATSQITSFVTTVAPKGLITNPNTGAISFQVIDSQGQPVSGANIHIVNTALDPDIILDRSSNATGNWVEVGLPPSVNGYEITVTKTGYSTDQTYPITVQNPNPVKPHATVVNGSITQITFTIDLLSTLNIRTLNQTCQNISGVNVNVRGAKLIGTNPNVYKYDQSFTSTNGLIGLNNIEWDIYTPTLLTGQTVMVYGTSPIQQISVLPGTTQTFTLILGPATTNSLLVIVKDAATGAAIEGAAVHLRKGGSEPQDYYGTTGGSVWTQMDWTGGPGQTDFTLPDRYFVDDGNIDINSVPTGVRLEKITGRYVESGTLESSTFDTGASSNFTTITWEPTSQSAGTTLRFQVATNNDNSTWNYKGPDGTASTYYTVSGTTISTVHDNERYIRYKAYLSTTDDKKTPVLTSINTNYVSGCFTPGQVIFPDLTAGQNYDLDVTMTGYQTQVLNSLNINGNQVLEVLMSP